MKKITQLLVFLILISCASQKSKSKIQFNEGIHLLELKKDSIFKRPTSILFKFSGDTHLINYYIDLSKKIEQRFHASNIKTAFVYKLTSTNPLQYDLNKIPQTQFDRRNFEAICTLKAEYIQTPKNWRYSNVRNRKTKHFLSFGLKQRQENENFIKGKFEIDAYFTFLTKGKVTSNLLFDIIFKTKH